MLWCEIWMGHIPSTTRLPSQKNIFTWTSWKFFHLFLIKKSLWIISYLTLQFHPAAILLGLHLLSLVLFDALQETVPALWVLHMLNAHVNPLGQDLAPVKDKQNEFKSTTNQNTSSKTNSLTYRAQFHHVQGPKNSKVWHWSRLITVTTL